MFEGRRVWLEGEEQGWREKSRVVGRIVGMEEEEQGTTNVGLEGEEQGCNKCRIGRRRAGLQQM